MFLFNKKSIGIDIADHTIEVVELSKDGKEMKVSSMGRVRLSPGIVERGRIKDEAKLAAAVKKVFSEAKPHPIAAKQVIFGLPEGQVYIHTFTLGPHNKQKIDKLVRKEAQENIPIPDDDLLFSYKILYENKKGVGILLVGTSSKVVDEWKSFFRKLRIDIEIFDIEPLATFRGLFTKPLKAPVCVVDIGAVTTHVAVFDKSGLRYAYAINVAGEQLTKGAARFLKKSEEEAEKLKREVGLSKPGEQVCSALIKVLQPVVVDIKTTLTYFKEQTGESVEEIVLVGGSSALKGLTDYVSANLGVPTRIGKQTLFKSNIPLVYIEAVGLALRGLEGKWSGSEPAIQLTIKSRMFSPKPSKGSLLQDDNQVPDSKLRRKKIILISLVIIGIIVIPLSFWYKGYRKAQQEAEIQSKLEMLESIEGIKKIEENGEVAAELNKEVIEQVVFVRITNTPTGQLNVREGPGTSYPKITKVFPGETYTLLEEKDNWYKIKIEPEGQANGAGEAIEGWVTSQYANKE